MQHPFDVIVSVNCRWQVVVRSLMIDDEGQIEECRQDQTREGKRRVLRAGKTTSATAGHHQPVGQGVDHPSDDQLSQDESCFSGRLVHCLNYARIAIYLLSSVILRLKNYFRRMALENRSLVIQNFSQNSDPSAGKSAGILKLSIWYMPRVVLLITLLY
jgi:hypothetical protein